MCAEISAENFLIQKFQESRFFSKKSGFFTKSAIYDVPDVRTPLYGYQAMFGIQRWCFYEKKVCADIRHIMVDSYFLTKKSEKSRFFSKFLVEKHSLFWPMYQIEKNRFFRFHKLYWCATCVHLNVVSYLYENRIKYIYICQEIHLYPLERLKGYVRALRSYYKSRKLHQKRLFIIEYMRNGK
mgnify:CR=1 FL=1